MSSPVAAVPVPTHSTGPRTSCGGHAFPSAEALQCPYHLHVSQGHHPNQGLDVRPPKTVGYRGHEATETGLAYAPVSQAHGHNHIVQCFSCCTAAQTSSVPHQVVADCALALVLWTLRSARTHHPPTVPVSL